VHPADVQHATDAGLDLLRVIGRLVLHNVTLPGHPELAIDHVVAGPSGVYVINTIAPSGSVSMAGNILVCAGTSMMDEVREVSHSAAVLRNLLSGAPVAPILCFHRNAEVAGVVGEVAVCSTENILELLSGQPDVLDAVGQRDVMRILSDALIQAVRRETRVELAAAPKPKHRHKTWSLRRTPAEPAAEIEPVVELTAVPDLVVEEVPEVVEETVEAESVHESVVVANGPVLELAPEVLDLVAALVADSVEEHERQADAEREVDDEYEAEFELAEPVAEVIELAEPEPEAEPEPVATARLIARAPARPAARPANRTAARAPARPARVVTEQAPEPESEENRPVWSNSSPDRDEVLPAEPEATTAAKRARFTRPHVDVRPTLTKVSGVLARLAPAEPVESVSALKDTALPAPHPSKFTPASRPSTMAAAPLPAWAMAPTPRPQLASAPPPVQEPPAKRSSIIWTALVAALLVSAVIMVSPKVPSAVTWGKGLFVDQPNPPAGTLISVGSSALEPPYDVTASAPVPVTSTPAGTTVRDGNRLVGIQFRVQNRGTMKLTLPVGARLEAVDALGIGYSPTSTVAKTNLGATLPKVLNVGPGAILNGSLVFSLPKGRTIEQIRLRLPDAEDGSVAWNVD